MLKLHLFGATLEGVDDRARPGFEGYSIGRGGLTGWWGRPAGVGGGSRRPGAHGEFDTPLYLPGRVVTVAGQVRQRDSRSRALAADRLAGLGADGERGRVVVEEDGFSTWAWCRVLSADVERFTSGHHPEYDLMLRCADPRRYGERRSEPTTSNVGKVMVNRGNFPASPRFRIAGPQPGGYQIWGADELPYTVGAVPANSTDVVDFATGLVTRDGVVLTGAVVTPRTWTVPAGGTKEWGVTLTGSGSAAGEITDTYV
ncbi:MULTISPECIES: hypothetical protein [unclassified Agrococcus]|uniref:hypothetical protein n=1 Tax=unclassified Agrococcus TaxID=2615065 RepID=UPI00360FAB73